MYPSNVSRRRSSILAHRVYLYDRLIIRRKVMEDFIANSPHAFDSHLALLTSLGNALEHVTYATKKWKDHIRTITQRHRSGKPPMAEVEVLKQAAEVGKNMMQADRKLAMVIGNIILFLDAVPDVEALPAALGQCPDHFFSRASNVEADKNGD